MAKSAPTLTRTAEMETLGQRLSRVIKKEKRMRLGSIAEEMGIHYQVMTRWLNDTHEPTAASLHQLAGIIGVSLDDLLADIDWRH